VEGASRKEIKSTTYQRTIAHRRVEEAERRVSEVEVKLELSPEDRWDENNEDYRATLKYIKQRKYQLAVDKLERLVVQRLFELTKLNISGTGYKLRTHISRALKTRSNTIRKALDKYNKLAVEVQPPRPTLSFKEVVSYTFLAEFDLLRDARQDVRERPWSKPVYREAMERWYKLQCARDEIDRLNIEVQRLATHLRDEELDYESAIRTLSTADHGLATELRLLWDLCKSVNHIHRRRLFQIAALP
ncbi:hypothetical protein BD410DRAFT_701546, partial [Rickenella mellea]